MIASPETLEVGNESRPRPDSSADGEPQNSDATNSPATDDYVYLVGRPTLRRYIRFVRGRTVSSPDKGNITEDWQAAHGHIRALAKEEAGLADNPALRKLGPEYEPLLVEFLKDPLVRHGYNTVPTEVAMVELDRLVVYQKHIDLTFVRQLKNKLGAAPDHKQVFQACLPYDHPHPPVKWSRVHNDTFVFMSPSNDLRLLGTMPLQPGHITGQPPRGSPVGVVGIAVGFGSNFLNAVYAEKRLILNNGSHRAYALREMGFTHVPCVVQHVSSRAELEVLASAEVRRDPDDYLKHPRPSLLKDYFDPKLRKIFQVHRRLSMVTVKFEVDKAYVPAW
jgi:hypothetical protein